MRAIPQAAVELVSRWEGVKLKAYQDSVGIWTIGYGHIQGVKQGDLINQAQAKAFLKKDLQEAAAKLERKIGLIVNELSENQYAALLSFVFNLGTGNPNKPEWTIWKRLRAKQFDQVPGELIKFVNAGGKKIQGLVNRRTDEIRVWSTDELGSEDVEMPSSVTRFVDTPPTVADPVAPHKSVNVWAAVTAFLGGLWATITQFLGNIPDWAKQALSVIDPFSDRNPIVQNLAMGLSTMAAVASLFVLTRTLKRKNEARR